MLRTRSCVGGLAFGAVLVAAAVPANADDVGQAGAGKVWVDFGYSAIRLPEMSYVGVGNVSVDTFSKIENHDGNLDSGFSVSAGVQTPVMHGAGWQGLWGVGGFYSQYDDTQSSRCVTDDLPASCQFSALADDPSGQDTRQIADDAPGVDVRIDTDRQVDLWGISSEFILSQRLHSAPAGFSVRVGADYRRLTDERSLSDIVAVGTTAMPLPSLEDTLTTDYIGAYVGFEDSIPMGKGGLRLGLSGQAGIYYADTQYDGTSSDGFTPTSLSLEDDDVAAILSGKIELTQAFGNIEVSLFGKGEWYSYVPTVIYNDKDAGSVQSTVLNAKTSIEDDEAESYTVGGKIAVKLN